MWNFTLRRITSLAIFFCTLFAIFLAMSHFPVLDEIIGSKRSSIISETLDLEEPVILAYAGYATENEENLMMKLSSPSAPELYPTPRRPRRGVADDTFGTCLKTYQFNVIFQ